MHDAHLGTQAYTKYLGMYVDTMHCARNGSAPHQASTKQYLHRCCSSMSCGKMQACGTWRGGEGREEEGRGGRGGEERGGKGRDETLYIYIYMSMTP